MNKKDILEVFRAKSTVFTFKEISLMLGETNLNLLKRRVNHHVKTGKLFSPRRHIYTKDKNYNPFELGVKIYTPSYISLETILQKEGMIFQYYKNIYVISYISREIACDKQKYIYKKIKNAVLNNPSGLEDKDGYFIAGKERAFLDTLYLYKNYHFDNLKPINWDFCFELGKIYENKSLIKRINSHYAGYKNT